MLRALAFAALTAALLAPPPARPVLAFLASLWNAPAPKEGCGMDPSGWCNTVSPQPGPETEAGCGMDPSGSPKCS